jgi:transposase
MPTMLTQLLFPACTGVRVDQVRRETAGIHIAVTTTRRWARCPLCGRRSRWVHSRYRRTLTDLPWCGTPVTIHLLSRRFRCRVHWCRRKVCTERVPALTAASARRTVRERDQLVCTAFALGGEPGQRFTRRSGTPVSARTLLRLVRSTALPVSTPVTALGVDDWAFRRGTTYGTILVNLTTHRVIDLLPDRQAATFASWLQAHPEIQVITRDRGGAYADGARQGAPQALQIADRFHLLCNVTHALQRYLGRKHSALRHAGQIEPVADPTEDTIPSAPPPAAPPAHGGRDARLSRERRARRAARYEEVKALRAHGYSIRAIATRVALSKGTVLKFVQAERFPELQARPPRRTPLTSFKPYLRARRAAGCHNAKQLLAELRDQGFTGGCTSVADCVKPWRFRPPPRLPAPGAGAAPGHTPAYGPRQVCWLLLRTPSALTAEEDAFLTRLYHACPQVALAEALVEEFAAVLRTRDVDGFYAWLRGVALSGISELRSVAHGMWIDRAAVAAAVATNYSNGQLEGQVNRLKVLKRAMYGRAKFDLLRKRVLYDSAACHEP